MKRKSRESVRPDPHGHLLSLSLSLPKHEKITLKCSFWLFEKKRRVKNKDQNNQSVRKTRHSANELKDGCKQGRISSINLPLRNQVHKQTVSEQKKPTQHPFGCVFYGHRKCPSICWAHNNSENDHEVDAAVGQRIRACLDKQCATSLCATKKFKRVHSTRAQERFGQ